MVAKLDFKAGQLCPACLMAIGANQTKIYLRMRKA